MSTRGRESNMKEKRGKSPSLSRKSEIEQQKRSPNPPSTLERKKVSASTETKNVPSAQNVRKQLSVDKNKPPRRSLDKLAPPSKATSTRSTSSERNVVGSSSVSTKTTSLAKSKDVGKSHPLPRPLQSKNSVNVKKDNMNVSGKKQSRQPPKGLRNEAMATEKKPNMSEAPKPDFSSEEDHNTITYEEDDKNMPAADDGILVFGDDDKQHLDDEDDDLLHGEVEFEDGGEIHLGEPSDPVAFGGDQEMAESEIYSQDNVITDESVDNEHTNDQDSEINQQDQSEEALDVAGGLPHSKVDGENPEPEKKEVVENENAGEAELTSKDVEHIDSAQSSIPEAEGKDQENKEIKPKEHEVEEGIVEVPTVEDTKSKMAVKNQQGATHGKKDTGAYNEVIEETVSKLWAQRKNKVRALVGAFETVISLESDAP